MLLTEDAYCKVLPTNYYMLLVAQHKMLRLLHSRNTHDNSQSKHACLLWLRLHVARVSVYNSTVFLQHKLKHMQSHSDFSIALYELYQSQNIP